MSLVGRQMQRMAAKWIGGIAPAAPIHQVVLTIAFADSTEAPGSEIGRNRDTNAGPRRNRHPVAVPAVANRARHTGACPVPELTSSCVGSPEPCALRSGTPRAFSGCLCPYGIRSALWCRTLFAAERLLLPPRERYNLADPMPSSSREFQTLLRSSVLHSVRLSQRPKNSLAALYRRMARWSLPSASSSTSAVLIPRTWTALKASSVL
jgi:hypothetical protein